MTDTKDGASTGSGSDNGDALVVKDPYQSIFLPARKLALELLAKLAEETEDAPTKKQLKALVKSANPQQKGRESTENVKWQIPSLRIVHGVTREKPEGTEQGDMYTTTGFKVEQPFKLTPLYIYYTNRKYPAGSSGGNPPECSSPDGVYGRPYGKCMACQYLPREVTGAQDRTGCDGGIGMVVLSQDMKLYRVEFFKTSRAAGENIDQLSAVTDAMWDRWFSLRVELRNYEGRSWYCFKSVASSQLTPEHVKDAADILSDLLIAERKAALTQFYAVTRAEADAIETVNENIDPSLTVEDNPDDNPDLSGGGV